ncbi:ABC transporter permease [Marispirochaeta aestuarii]|uniref:ABC transporter permease n=1 Tax=Marispirochaeta aestuarii TaxID=1963862 RepID=UPI0029C874D4|nr:ABC transporter permease [Marispirochaeta aestuarii]
MRRSASIVTNRIRDRLPSMAAGLLFILLWEAFCRLLGLAEYILPAPSAITAALVRQFDLMLPHIGVTLFTAMSGFILSLLVAAFFSLIMDLFPVLRRALYPYIVVSQTVPIIFIYPLFLIWFGFGLTAKVVVVVLVCFFPVAVSLIDGLQNTDPDLIDLFRGMRAKPLQIFLQVRLPGALPNLFSGLRIAATYSVMGAVIGEWLGAQTGMGVYMMRSYKTFNTPRVFAAILVVVIVSLMVVAAVSLAERFFLSWKYANLRSKS